MLDDSAAILADEASRTSRTGHPASAPAPEHIASNDELYLLGRCLEDRPQAGLVPEHYWEEAVWRDAGDVRCHVALGRTLAAAGRVDEAERHLRSAVERLTARGAGPVDGEAHYRLGALLARRGRTDEAADVLAVARRIAPWRVPAGVALAQLESAAGRLLQAERLLRDVLAIDPRHARATALLAAVLWRSREAEESAALVDGLLARDPRDPWARDLAGRPVTDDADELLDVALEYRAAGMADDALRVLALALAVDAADLDAPSGTRIVPLVHYHAALLHEQEGRPDRAEDARWAAQLAPPEDCRPLRLADAEALEAADTDDTTARFLLGGWYAAHDRIEDAFAAFWSAAAHDPREGVRVRALRELGIASCTAYGDPEAALAYYERARALAPRDAGLLRECDRLRERLGLPGRLALLEENEALVLERDDLTLEYAALLVESGRAGAAQRLLLGRVFAPGAGGEGRVLEVWDATMIALAEVSTPADAATFLCAALAPPACLGAVRSTLADTAELHLRRGCARSRLGDQAGACDDWETAAGLTAEPLEVTAPRFSGQTVSSIRALLALGRVAEADRLAAAFAVWIDEESRIPAHPGSGSTRLFPLEPQQEKDELLAGFRAQLAALAAEREEAATERDRAAKAG
nr:MULTISPECIES: tetratricopeptide repeat protein [unclassified Rathayibacter]